MLCRAIGDNRAFELSEREGNETTARARRRLEFKQSPGTFEKKTVGVFERWRVDEGWVQCRTPSPHTFTFFSIGYTIGVSFDGHVF